MSESFIDGAPAQDTPSPGADEASVATKPSRGLRWQWSLLTLLLATAAIAAWLAWWDARRQSQRLAQEIDEMRELAGELFVADRSQYAVIEIPEQWQEEDQWRIYCPLGAGYRLYLATREISSGRGKPSHQASIEPGEHSVRLERTKRENTWHIHVLVDEKQMIEAAEPADWDPGTGGSGNGPSKSVKQQPRNEPLKLKYWRFHLSNSTPGPNEPTNGLALWIESQPGGPTPPKD